MPQRPIAIHDIPAEPPALLLLVGDEELLIGRAIAAISAAVLKRDADAVETERSGADIEGPELHELLGPSLFGDSRLLVLRSGQDVRSAAVEALRPYLGEPGEGTTIVVHHAGGGKGKVLLEAVRAAGAVEVLCAKLTRPEERHDFVRAEVRRAGGAITPDATAVLVDAVGSDLRELAAVSAQLVSDSGGRVDVDIVRAYHRGRAEVTGFAVADLAVNGRGAEALETLRHALSIGVAEVLIADALADGIRSIARVASAGRMDPYALARTLGMPPWKVKKAAAQARGWTEPAVRRALGVVAELNADVKGAAASGPYALERAIRRLSALRAAR
ncbi:MAG TPA: DNA polymerase III subunit delta [Jatrophihabitantaceae bacterium]|nr:DNA polymerase III subunit delta [Jatrophihabitantaceae bacterium]